MARTPIADRPALAQWLIRARGTAKMTAPAFLAALQAEGHKAPHPSNYAQWESGVVTPEETSLAPIIEFWAARKVAGPAVADPGPTLAAALMALAQELGAVREERTALAARVDQLEAMVRALVPAGGTGAGTAAAATPPPLPG